MSGVPSIPPRAPVGQQGPPARAAAFDSWRSLRGARGPLLLGYGDGLSSPRGRAQTIKVLYCRNLDTAAYK